MRITNTRLFFVLFCLFLVVGSAGGIDRAKEFNPMSLVLLVGSMAATVFVLKVVRPLSKRRG
jgi:hypothetical protein